MDKEKFVKWFKAVTIRAIRTVAQVSLAILTTAEDGEFFSTDWHYLLEVIIKTIVITYLMGITGLPEVEEEETEE